MKFDPNHKNHIDDVEPLELMADEYIDEQVDIKILKRKFVYSSVILVLSLLVFFLIPESVSLDARKALALLTFVGFLWLTEALHVTVVALLVPVLAVGLGIGDISIKAALTSYSNPTIFLFFGGFALATALHIQKLDKKIAFWLISLSGARLGLAVILLFVATAALSMWISNTATAALMLPLAIGIIDQMQGERKKATAAFILLGIAYSASLGGLGTIVGSPPNAIAAKALNIDFVSWMKIGLPLVLVVVPTMILTLYVILRPNLSQKITMEKQEVIAWNRSRIITIVLFIVIASLWIFGKPLGKLTGIAISDGWTAILAVTFVVILGLASWKQVSDNTDWGVLLLFGGGLVLSEVLKLSGASVVLGDFVASHLDGMNIILVIAGVATFILLLTEFTSNTASAALLVPIFAAIGEQMGLRPEILVMVIGLGASMAFMLPVATPPNAIVFGTGKVKQRTMVIVGAWLDFICIFLLTAYIGVWYL